ncbi:hypothetical protein F4779DRAFT_251985 [Xylariaceae sp. FL0662B]|nr:hypothetical protein F4779DRAFT_251985 [Xylariaceae sp. FL0662B]
MPSHNPASSTNQGAQLPQTSTGGASAITKDGSVVTSSDPTTKPDASLGQKIKGDVHGAVSGSIGSVQAATGTILRNKNLEEKGTTKMQEEDERLGAKRGVMPVGSGQRMTKEDVK